ncbi:hypothetical protein FRC03_009171 [Tulasnella sp. 419]|nr:hypothetical protein FRC03_009171 [Tulasnella sp. 419]
MSMPKDIFIEICFHLFPIDLLHLSWSSKGLRSILMSKSAQYIWRAARESQLPTLPPCPHDLTEPWYTALLFSAACQLCGRRKVQYKHFSLRISHCKPCYPKYVIPAHKINRNYPASDRHIARKLFNVLSDTYAPHGVICNSKKLDKSFREYKALDNEYDRHKLLESCKQYSTEVQNHARKVEKWQSEQARVKEAQDKEISEARWESIQAKLEVLGWEKRDFPFPGHEEWLKLTRKPQPLNDRVWKELYPQLEPILQLQKRNRLELEEDKRRSFRASRIWELYRLFIKNHPGDYFYPKSILVYPSFTKIRDMDDAHGTIDALWEASIGEIEEDLRCCTETIMQEARNWYGRCIETEMGSNSADGTDKSMVSIQRHLDMTLVTSVFQCSRCDEPLWLATFIHHSHITEKCCQYKRQGKAPGDVATDLLDVNCLRYNPGLQALMKNMLVGAGYDPLSCTVADFVLAPWNLYSCERCEKDYQLPLKFEELRGPALNQILVQKRILTT